MRAYYVEHDITMRVLSLVRANTANEAISKARGVEKTFETREDVEEIASEPVGYPRRWRSRWARDEEAESVNDAL